VRLYSFTRAPNPRRVRWFMAEKGIDDIEIVETNIIAGEHKTPAFLEMAGFPHVPALELDDGTAITESIAICRYLEALHPDPNLMGRTPQETAEIEMWARRCEMQLANPLMMTVRLNHPALAALEAPNRAVGDYFRARAESFTTVLDRRLEGREFIAADRLTVADIVAAVGIDFTRIIKYQLPEGLTNLERWLSAMRQRPGFAAGT
jgi:glutathione S-transferase